MIPTAKAAGCCEIHIVTRPILKLAFATTNRLIVVCSFSADCTIFSTMKTLFRLFMMKNAQDNKHNHNTGTCSVQAVAFVEGSAQVGQVSNGFATVGQLPNFKASDKIMHFQFPVYLKGKVIVCLSCLARPFCLSMVVILQCFEPRSSFYF